MRKKGGRPSLRKLLPGVKVSRLKRTKAHVLVCAHKTCRRQGSKAVFKELKRALKERGLRDCVLVTKVKCLDQCGRGPVVAVYPEGVWYGGVDETSARRIVAAHTGAAGGGSGAAVGAKILHDMREGERDAKR